MSFEEYAHCMTRKYKLAVAVALLRIKPENISPEQYIALLKEKILRHENMEIDDDILLNGNYNLDDNDFNIEEKDDSVIINEFNQSFDLDKHLTKKSTNIIRNNEIGMDANRKTNDNIEVLETSSINLLQQMSNIQEPSSNNNSNEITILEDSTDEANSFDDVLKTLRDIDNDTGLSQINKITTSAPDYPLHLSATSLSNFNIHLYPEDNLTICNTLPEENLNFINLLDKNDTQLPVDKTLKAKVMRNLNKHNKTAQPAERNMDESEIFRQNVAVEDNIAFNNTQEMEVDLVKDILETNEQCKDVIKDKAEIVHKNIAKEVNKRTGNSNKYNVVNDNNNQNISSNVDENAIADTQDTILYSLHGFTPNTYHISQSQCASIEIPQALLYGRKTATKELEYNQIHSKDGKIISNNIRKETTSEDKDQSVNENACNYIEFRQLQGNLNPNEISYITDDSGRTYAVLQSIQVQSDSLQGNVNKKHIQATANTNYTKSESQRINTENDLTNEETGAENAETNKSIERYEKNTELLELEEIIDLEMDSEVVPFKVVKELSKIKAYLNEREQNATDGSSLDSGYRSDSQNSFKSKKDARTSDWVHQSANCLFNYIISCPLVSATQDIVAEISQVLGQLIDRLHEQEKYPAFLEELLEKINTLLCELLKENGSPENVLLDKDETIQRLLLLNTSTHILKYSIEKVADILEKAHSELISKDNFYELINIEETENLRYIFHVLEFFIQIYLKVKDTYTQTTQNSQDSTKLLKKSSITEIWRKKWNPDVKGTKSVGSQEKSCALTKCSEVLNKIIVDCMEGYSLVSFAALQCFNLLQN